MKHLVIACLLILAVCGLAFSQTTFATITGTVTDASGAVVPQANVTVTNLETNITTTATSNEAGVYSAAQLREGNYSLKAEAPGFAAFVTQGITLTARDIRRVDVTLQVGATSTAVEVSAGATLIETETARISNTQNDRLMKSMPLNARWLWAYFNQVPNMINGSDGYRFAGSTGNENNWSIDGTTMNDGQGWAIGPQLNYIESFQEVKVDMANNTAEFGAIGHVDVVTKSGTNELHGSVYDTFMTPGLRARNFFATGIWTGRFHIFGGSVSGPVYIPKVYNGKNKTFFFFSMERSAGNASFTNLNPTVPIAAWRQGDFSGLRDEGGNPITIYDPTTGSPFPDNKIPAGSINNVSKLIQDQYYPLPNFGDPNVFQANNYREIKTMPWSVPVSRTLRLDHHFSDKNFVYGRAIITNGPATWWESNLPTVGLHRQTRPTRSATVSYTHVFSASLINEARWGMDYNNIPSEGPVRGYDEVKRLGLTGLAPNLPDVPGLLQVNWSGIGLQGISQDNGNNPGFRNHNEQWMDHVSWFRGRHTFKFGVDLARVEGDDFSIPGNLFGGVNFSNKFTSLNKAGEVGGHPYADFLLGIPTYSSRAFPSLLLERNRWQYATYFADEFKVTPSLTLNVGLRYQLHQPWRENHGRMSIFDIGSGSIVVPDTSIAQISPLFPTSYVNVVSASSAGLPSETLIRPDKNDFAPRISLAWRPFGNNTVLRAGYGIFYEVTPFDFTSSGSPFQLAEPGFTNPADNPLVILPRVFPDRAIGSPYATVNLPSAVNPGLITPRSQQYNATIEHQQWNTGFRLSYIGTAQRQGSYSYNYNSPIPDDRPFTAKARPFQQYPEIMYRTNGAGHQYHGLSAEVKRSMVKNLYFQAAYTLARDRYDAFRWGTIENPFDRHREVGNAFDMPRHRVTANWVWDLPFGKGRKFGGNVNRWVNLIAGGWVLSGTYAFHSGNFLTPLWSGPDPNGIAYTESDAPWVTIRPDQLRDPNLPSGERTIERWFDTSAFVAPQKGHFGNAAKGTIRGPRSNVLNAGIQKELIFSERGRVILEMTSRNVLNHANFNNPGTDISDTSGVGRISWAGGISDDGGPREERLGLRIEF